MKILDAKFVQDFIKMANDGFLQGWHERNGGNLSYRLKPEEVEMIRPRLNAPGEWTAIGTEVPGLAGEFFLVTGSGKYFRNIIVDPEVCLAIIELDEAGVNYRIRWGLVEGESVIQNMRLMTERYTNCWEDWTEGVKNKSNWNRE